MLVQNRQLPAVKFFLLAALPSLFAAFSDTLEAGEEADLFQLSLAELVNVEILSASEFSEGPLTVASSVSVVDEDDWRKLGSRRSKDPLGSLPGVQLFDLLYGAQTVTIRGYSSSPRGHETLLDGVPINSFTFNNSHYQYNNVNLGTLEKIELIRGPVSVQYGSDAFHGAVSMQSYSGDRNSEQAHYTQVRTSLASNDLLTTGLRHSSNLDQHYIDISLEYLDQGDQDIAFDWEEATASGSSEWAREEESHQFIAKFGRQAEEAMSYELGFYTNSQERDDFHGYGQELIPGLDELRSSNIDTDFHLGKGYLQIPLANTMEANLQLFYWESSLEDFRWGPGKSQWLWFKDENRKGAKLTIKQESNPINTRWSLAFEGDWAEITDAYRKDLTTAGDLIIKEDEPTKGLKRDIKSVTAQATTTLSNDKIQLHYGIRYDDINVVGGDTSGRLGLVYLPTSTTSLKLLYGRGFRPPSGAERRGFRNPLDENLDLESETLDSYEIVYIYQTDNSLAEFTLFYNELENEITDSDFGADGGPTYINLGDGESKGAEAQFKYTVKQWAFDLSGSYVDSTNNQTGADYVAFPEWIFNLGIAYKLPAQHLEIYLFNRVEEGMQESIDPASEDLSTVWRTDLHVGYQQSEHLIWTLDFRNLLDRDNYRPYIYGMTDGIPGDPFSAMLGLHFTF
ncbi:TonB-dependent receptor plug domain-containing protein [Oceanicoccus sagamiensis]|uniref:TonB-dependent receptor plug domain-containing protein n=1 Tax=Oceanicoccus sagamiensis TaxID=716816 RepID=A0A1X9N379_9GAMM|nr:TonB-dependent receptor [Oceanicoccus sagamiensis]ARN72668.1 hypothetical protein BST96_00180 [Oceanicoccus sagamiensis]